MKQCRQGDIQAAIIGCGGCLGEGLVHDRDIVSAAALAMATDNGSRCDGGLVRGTPLARRLLFNSLSQPPAA